MERALRILNALANVAIVALAVIIAYQFWGSRGASIANAPKSHLGQSLNLDHSVSKTPDHKLLVFLSETCIYCTQEMPFIRRLLKEISRKSASEVKTIVVMPRADSSAREYLRGNLGFEPPIIPSAGTSNLVGFPTPSIVVLDSKNVVVGEWIGAARSSDHEKRLSEILARSGN